MASVKVWKLGTLNFRDCWKLQKILAQKHQQINSSRDKILNTILLVEHNPVYTVGIRDKNYNKEDEIRLTSLGAEFHRTNRGGLITYHGPGQLTIYPIINLKDFKLTMRTYIKTLENSVIDMCNILDLNAYTCEHTGVWINDKKVCAIGVHGSRYITTHGIAINNSIEMLDWFQHIVPCGLEGKGVTSLSAELNKVIPIKDTIDLYMKSFIKHFKCHMLEISNTEKSSLLKEADITLM